MSQQELVMWIGAVTLLTGTLLLLVAYHKRLRPLINEYWQAKSLLDNIVTTFKRRYDELSRVNSLLGTQVESNTSLLKEQTTNVSRLSENLTNLSVQVDILTKSDEKVRTDMSALQIAFEKVRSEQDTSRAREAQTHIPRTVPDSETPKQQPIPQTDLTETEQTVLRFLNTEGPMTSRQIEAKIAKTREHTARLMKKLWQEGYVERETHRTPFTYRIASGFHELEAQRA